MYIGIDRYVASIGGHNVTGYGITKGVTEGGTSAELHTMDNVGESTVYQVKTGRYTEGPLVIDGYVKDDNNSIHELLKTSMDNAEPHSVMIARAGAFPGSECKIIPRVIRTTGEVEAGDGVIRLSAVTYTPSSSLPVYHDARTIINKSVTGTVGPPYSGFRLDNGNPTSGGWAAAIHISNVNFHGASNFKFRLRQSSVANPSTPANWSHLSDEITVTPGRTVYDYFISGTGTVNRWIGLDMAFHATGGSNTTADLWIALERL